MGRPRRGKSNPHLLSVISRLRTVSRDNEVNLWRAVADRLEGSARNWAEVNLHHLDRVAPDGAVVVVPGKVLATGALSKKLVIGAWSFSERAREKIEAAGGKAVALEQLSADHPRGSGLLLLG